MDLFIIGKAASLHDAFKYRCYTVSFYAMLAFLYSTFIMKLQPERQSLAWKLPWCFGIRFFRCFFSNAEMEQQSPTVQSKQSLRKLSEATLKDSGANKKFSKQIGWSWRIRQDCLVIGQDLFVAPAALFRVSTVEALERKTTGFLHRLLGFPHRLSSTAHYGSRDIVQLLFSCLIQEFKVAYTWEALQHRDVWEVAESRLRQKEPVGTLVKGRAGLVCFPPMQGSG